MTIISLGALTCVLGFSLITITERLEEIRDELKKIADALKKEEKT